MNRNLIIMMLLLLASCSNHHNVVEGEIFVDFKEYEPMEVKGEEDIFNYSNYLDSVSYVTLETNEECIIGEVRDAHFVNDKIFLNDRKNVYVFDKNGTFISKVDQFGRGRGEYVSLSYFDVNPTNEEINIYDSGYDMVHVYSVNGDFVRNVRIEGIPRDFCVLSNGNYLFYTPDKMKNHYRGVWQTDPQGNFINQPIDWTSPFEKVILYDRNLIHVDNEVVGCIGPMGFDNIYHISSDSSWIAYHVNTNTKISKNVMKNEGIDISKEEFYNLDYYYETDGLISFRIETIPDKAMDVMYDKKTRQVKYQINYGQEGTPFESGDKVPFRIPLLRSDYGIGIGAVPASMIIGIPELKEKLAPNITIESNPIVVLYYYKR